jgi:hypothetical protein
MADPIAAVVVALAAFLGLSASDAAEVGRGEIASFFPAASSPGEVVGNVLLVADAPWSAVMARLDDPSRQPGVAAAGRLTSEDGGLDAFLRAARLDEGDVSRLRDCRAGACKAKVTNPLLQGQTALPARAADADRVRAYLSGLWSIGPCARDLSCDLTAVDRKEAVSLTAVTKRLAARPSFAEQLALSPDRPPSSRAEWRTETYWKRDVMSVARVQIIEGRLGDHRAVLHRRDMIFATHYFYGARVETLFVEAGGRLVVAQSNIYQTDKTSGFSGLERALIRMLGRRRFEAHASEWRRASDVRR